MIYLALEIILWLAAAALLGLVSGWLLRAALRGGPRAVEEDQSLVTRMTLAEAEFEAKTLAAEAAVARLKADLHAATSQAATLEGESGRRLADMEQALKSQLRSAEALAHERGHALDQARNMFATAQGEWTHRARQADSRAADASERLDQAEAQLAALAAELETARAAPVAPDRADEIEALTGERDALHAERNDLAARLHALEAAAPAIAPDRLNEIEALTGERDTLLARIAALESEAPRKPARAIKPGDDFTRIEGLGVAMEKALKAQGIETFEALAALAGEDVRALSQRMRNRFADRYEDGGWAQKAAALAAAKQS